VRERGGSGRVRCIRGNKMKMEITDCLAEMIKQKFGKEKWEEILTLSDMGKGSNSFRYFIGFDIIDEKVMDIIQNTCKVLDITREQAAEAFGDYWINVYAPKLYPKYFDRFKSAKAFIMGMDQVHREVTEDIENAHPPRFDFEELDENTLRVHYKSKRKMIDFYIGLVKGIGIHFDTKLDIVKESDDYVLITF
jgi:RNase P/RNase MRP subunit POP5